jgi:hypothetical protein
MKTSDSGFTDSFNLSIVAKCGEEERVINLPFIYAIDFDYLKRKDPQIADLWNLESRIPKSVFGESALFDNISKEQDSQLQLFGQSLIPDLQSGKYDKGFSCEGCDPHPTLSLLKNYVPNIQVELKVTLMNAERFQFTKYVAPSFPRLAQRMRLESKVNLELVVDQKSGKTIEARMVGGHPIFKESAIGAALQWQFNSKIQKLDQPLNLVLDYSFQCPLPKKSE